MKAPSFPRYDRLQRPSQFSTVIDDIPVEKVCDVLIDQLSK